MDQNAKQLSEMTQEELWQLFPIILSRPNPDWKNYYEEEKALLENSFGDLPVRIEHIGSTAVAGLIAKPTVDILLEVDPSASPDAVRRDSPFAELQQSKIPSLHGTENYCPGLSRGGPAYVPWQI